MQHFLLRIVIVGHIIPSSQNLHHHVLELNQFHILRQRDSRHQRECQRKSQQQQKQTLAKFLCPLIHEAPSDSIRFKSVFAAQRNCSPIPFHAEC